MSFKLVIFAAAVFTCQVNGQVGGLIRPFITGYANGISEFAKPFVQLGQAVVSPAGDLFARRPQWLVYPNQQRPIPAQSQPVAFEGFEGLPTAIPSGGSIVQFLRPRPFHPHFFQVINQVRPSPLPAPVPVPAPASSSEESSEIYSPSNLLITPDSVESEEVSSSENLSSLKPTDSASLEAVLPASLEANMPATLEANVPATLEANVPATLEANVPATIEANVPATLEANVPTSLNANVPVSV